MAPKGRADFQAVLLSTWARFYHVSELVEKSVEISAEDGYVAQLALRLVRS